MLSPYVLSTGALKINYHICRGWSSNKVLWNFQIWNRTCVGEELDTKTHSLDSWMLAAGVSRGRQTHLERRRPGDWRIKPLICFAFCWSSKKRKKWRRFLDTAAPPRAKAMIIAVLASYQWRLCIIKDDIHTIWVTKCVNISAIQQHCFSTKTASYTKTTSYTTTTTTTVTTTTTTPTTTTTTTALTTTTTITTTTNSGTLRPKSPQLWRFGSPAASTRSLQPRRFWLLAGQMKATAAGFVAGLRCGWWFRLIYFSLPFWQGLAYSQNLREEPAEEIWG